MPFSQVFGGCHDREARPKFTSLTQTREWLKTLPDVSEDVELRRIHEAVHVLEKPTQQALKRICAQWQQAQKKNRKELPLAVIVEELTEKVLDASNRAQRRVPRRGGAEQPAASSGAAQPAHDEEEMLKFTSLREVGAWLVTLPDLEGDAELRMIQEAVQLLKKPTKQSIFPICAAWRQDKKRNGKNLTVDVVLAELTEKVLAASNGAQRRVAQSSEAAQPAASSGAADLTEHPCRTAR